MIKVPGHEGCVAKVFDSGNQHVFHFWEELSAREQEELIADLETVDFDLMERLYRDRDRVDLFDFSPTPYVPYPENAEDPGRKKAREAGVDCISAGKGAAFVVAGGQGSRLGFEGPKGKFPVGPLSGKTLFEIHGGKIATVSRRYGVRIPWLVMTSAVNHEETVAYFSDMGFFGLDPAMIKIFPQNMLPSLDEEGKLVLAEKHRLFMNPDGHGGSLTALSTSGALDWLQTLGVEVISYFQVDNPTVSIIDPVFFGYHVLGKAEATSKCLRKTGPDEKVGVFVTRDDGRVAVVEYSDLPEEKAAERDPAGNFVYSAGSPAIHLFSVSFIRSITGGGELSLPFHTARKKIQGYRDGGKRELNGFKFEKFVFDALPLTPHNVIIEARREDEFAPVKNATGVDSVESARELMNKLHRSWCGQRGIAVPENVKILEIDPSLAAGPEDLDAALVIPAQDEVYIR